MPRSGRTMRPMGRRRICVVPLRKLTNCCPTSRPVSMRIVVPELPQSRTSLGSCKPSRPRPWTINSVGVMTSICTPNWRITLTVERQSPPSRKLRTCVAPAAMLPNMTARCEMDLSPGTVQRPMSEEPG
jgi:hypothetical protein